MRIPTSYAHKCKTVAHVFQVLLIFVAGCLTIAVMTKGGETGGPTKYFLAMCFASVPAIIYLVMVPMWSRARRFANAYAFAILDALYTLLWFAAFVAVAVWNNAGIRQGAREKNIADGNCTTFKFGSESKCHLSEIAMGFGVMVFFFFVLTASISAYYLHKFRKDGVLPYEAHAANPHHLGGETTKDNAWSTEMDHDGRDSEDRHTERGGNQEEDEYALLNSHETDEGRHPGRPLSWGDDRTAAGGYSRADGVPMPYADYDHSNALSPGGYEEFRREASGSSPPYGAAQDTSYSGGGHGYSFSKG